MKQKPRVVFDSNIYLSAIIFGGNPRTCLELAKNKDIELFLSRAILVEIARNLQNKFGWNHEDIKDVIEGISQFSTVVTPKQRIEVIKNYPKDNKILEVALEAKADYIISGDKKHLLSLKVFKGISIISAKEFLDILYKN